MASSIKKGVPQKTCKIYDKLCARNFYLIKFMAEGLLLYLLNGTPAQVWSCEFCEIFKNIYFVKQLPTAASVYCQAKINLQQSLLESDLLLIHLI